MLYGASDTLIEPSRCARFADDLRKGGSKVEVIAYPGAVHQWDGGWSRRMIGHTLHGCRFRVERDGTVRDLNTLLPMSSPFTRKIILGLCANGPSYPIGADPATRAKSDRDMGRFLAKLFGAHAGGEN
jgi:dienelactone hydrolase